MVALFLSVTPAFSCARVSDSLTTVSWIAYAMLPSILLANWQIHHDIPIQRDWLQICTSEDYLHRHKSQKVNFSIHRKCPDDDDTSFRRTSLIFPRGWPSGSKRRDKCAYSMERPAGLVARIGVSIYNTEIVTCGWVESALRTGACSAWTLIDDCIGISTRHWNRLPFSEMA